MIIVVVVLISFLLWISYEVWRAPLLDDNYKVIKPAKTFNDLFKYKNKK